MIFTKASGEARLVVQAGAEHVERVPDQYPCEGRGDAAGHVQADRLLHAVLVLRQVLQRRVRRQVGGRVHRRPAPSRRTRPSPSPSAPCTSPGWRPCSPTTAPPHQGPPATPPGPPPPAPAAPSRRR